MKMKQAALGIALAMGVTALPAAASPFTSTSPTGGVLPAGVTAVGGVVMDLKGSNGNRIVSQLAASTLFEGFFDDGAPVAYRGNPGTIGIQTGFTPAVLGGLGGGIAAASIRFSLFDGDSAAGNFDHNANFLLINGLNFGNWSSVNAEHTNALGNSAVGGFSGGGFRNNLLDTGWFASSDATLLASLYTSLSSTGQAVFQLNDVSAPYDNFFDFTQGIDASLIDVGQGPIVTPGTVPEPGILALLGIGAVAAAWRRRARA